MLSYVVQSFLFLFLVSVASWIKTTAKNCTAQNGMYTLYFSHTFIRNKDLIQYNLLAICSMLFINRMITVPNFLAKDIPGLSALLSELLMAILVMAISILPRLTWIKSSSFSLKGFMRSLNPSDDLPNNSWIGPTHLLKLWSLALIKKNQMSWPNLY